MRDGLYQCKDCRSQFTITTKTPLHGTKLDLRIWITAIFKVLTSSKGISSVVMARELGVNQKTAWKMGHAIRELMDDRNLELAPLDEVVEVDEAYIGGAPKTMFNANVKAEQSGKPLVLVAVTRDGQARAEVVADKSKATLGPLVAAWVAPWNTVLMSDGNPSYNEVGQTMADHSTVIHSRHEYADPETGAHVNTAEAFISQIIRAQIGVYHNLGRKHLQRYLNELLWRWNHRTPVAEKTVVKYNKGRAQVRIDHDDLEADRGGRADAAAFPGRRR